MSISFAARVIAKHVSNQEFFTAGATFEFIDGNECMRVHADGQQISRWRALDDRERLASIKDWVGAGR